MPGSSTTPGRPGTRAHAPVRVAFRFRNGVGTRDMNLCEAQWLAYVLPYRRFAVILADANARLEANADCYSFIAVDFHHLLFAGFYRRTGLQELCNSWGESVIASPYAKASGLKTLFKPRETCFLIGTKSVNLGIRPSNLAYGTSFARGKTGTTLPKRFRPRSSEECRLKKECYENVNYVFFVRSNACRRVSSTIGMRSRF